MFDRILMVLEILLLIWIVAQGEAVRFYEKEVWRMNKERFEERAKWRKEKQEQTRKKSAIKISDSNLSITSHSPTAMSEPDSKITSAKSVTDL